MNIKFDILREAIGCYKANHINGAVNERSLLDFVDKLEQELEVTDRLLIETQRLLDAIPECEIHGKCVPHALEWIEKMKSEFTVPLCTCTRRDSLWNKINNGKECSSCKKEIQYKKLIMSYTAENQKLEVVTENLQGNLSEFREKAENRIMDITSWDVTHRLKLKSIVEKMFELQIELNEL